MLNCKTQLTAKRGDTFSRGLFAKKVIDKTPEDMTGTVVVAILTHTTGKVENLSVNVIDEAQGSYELYATPVQTAKWQVGLHDFEIRETAPDGVVISTQTIQILVE